MCRSRDEVERMLAREEMTPEAGAFRAHLKECADCRDVAGRVADEVLVRRVSEEGGHADPLALSRYLDGDLPERVRFLLEEHLSVCLECRTTLAEMRLGRHLATAQPLREFAYRPVMERAEGRPWSRAWTRPSVLAPAFGTALAAAVAFLWIGGHLSRKGAPDLATRPHIAVTPPGPVGTEPVPPGGGSPAVALPRPTEPSRSVEPQADPRTVPKDSKQPGRTGRPQPARNESRRSAPDPERPQPVAPVKPPDPKVRLAVLPEDPTGLPAWARADLERVRTEAPATRGATVPPPPPVTLLSPDPGNRAILETVPEFAWAPVEGANAYVVRLVTDPSDPDREPREAGATEVREPRHRFTTPLVPGERYVLSIRPVQPETGTWDAQNREAVYRLEVLGEEEARQARWALENAERYPVTAAMAMYRLGLYGDAAEATRHWSKDAPWQHWAAAIRSAHEDRLSKPAQ